MPTKPALRLFSILLPHAGDKQAQGDGGAMLAAALQAQLGGLGL
jgi:hypothetical protein